MTGRIIHVAEREHHCNPGWHERLGNAPWDPDTEITFLEQVDVFTPEGSIWECDCGNRFIAYSCHQPGCLMLHWRPETPEEPERPVSWLGRWWRARKDR